MAYKIPLRWIQAPVERWIALGALGQFAGYSGQPHGRLAWFSQRLACIHGQCLSAFSRWSHPAKQQAIREKSLQSLVCGWVVQSL